MHETILLPPHMKDCTVLNRLTIILLTSLGQQPVFVELLLPIMIPIKMSTHSIPILQFRHTHSTPILNSLARIETVADGRQTDTAISIRRLVYQRRQTVECRKW